MFVLNDTTGVVLFPSKLEHLYKAICNLEDTPINMIELSVETSIETPVETPVNTNKYWGVYGPLPGSVDKGVPSKVYTKIDEYILSIIGTTHPEYPENDIKLLSLCTDAYNVYKKYKFASSADLGDTILYSNKYKTCLVIPECISKETAELYKFEFVCNIKDTSDYMSIHNCYFENMDRLKEAIKSIEYIINIKNEKNTFVKEIKDYIEKMYVITKNKSDRVKREYFIKNMNKQFKNCNKNILKEILNDLACGGDEFYYYGFKQLVDLKCYNESEVQLSQALFGLSYEFPKQINFSEDGLSSDPSDLEKLTAEWLSKDLTKVNKLPEYEIDDSLRALYPDDNVSTISSKKLPDLCSSGKVKDDLRPWIQDVIHPPLSRFRNSLQ